MGGFCFDRRVCRRIKRENIVFMEKCKKFWKRNSFPYQEYQGIKGIFHIFYKKTPIMIPYTLES